MPHYYILKMFFIEISRGAFQHLIYTLRSGSIKYAQVTNDGLAGRTKIHQFLNAAHSVHEGDTAYRLIKNFKD